MAFQRRKLTVNRAVTAVVALLAVSLFGVAETASADEDAAAASKAAGAYTVFNHPEPGAPDYRIQEHLAQLVEQAPKGATIYGSMFTFTQTPVAQALSDAQARGVHVRLAIDSQGDGGANADPANQAQQILQAADLDQLVYCEGANESSSCVAERGGINHNKLFMFSRTGSKENVVWVGSYNLTKTQGRLFNNAVVHYGRPDLYQAFERDLEHMLAQDKDNDYYNSDAGTFETADGQVAFALSPRADSSGGTEPEAATDTVAELLARVSYEEDCRVDVTQAQFTGPRIAVAEELKRIAGLGCSVRIVHGDGLTQYTYDALHGTPNVRLRGFYDGTDPDSPITIHSKIITIHAAVDGKHQDLALSGSHNLTGPALRMHDEVLLISKQPKITKAFDANFAMLWGSATCVNVPSDVVCSDDA